MRVARRVAASLAVGLALTAASYAPPARAGIMDWINSLIAAPAAPMRETTSRFLDALKAGDGAKALAETSMAFKSGATADDLVAFGKGLKLDQYAGADWPEYRVQTELGKGTWGYIAGSLKGVAGELTPMTVGLAKEGDVWRIRYVRPALVPEPDKDASPKAPTLAELRPVLDKTLAAFIDGTAASDLAAVHELGSAAMKVQFKLDALNASYKSILDLTLDLAPVAGIEPKFDSGPTMSADGVASLEGRYPISNGTVRLKIDAVYEGLGWRLNGHNLSAKPEPAAAGDAVPAPLTTAELDAAIKQSNAMLERSLRAKDLTEFRHKAMALLVQVDQTADRFNAGLKPLLDSAMDLSTLADLEPVVTSAPAPGKFGGTALAYHYYTAQKLDDGTIVPIKVSFANEFVREGNEVRLYNFDINWKLPGAR